MTPVEVLSRLLGIIFHHPSYSRTFAAILYPAQGLHRMPVCVASRRHSEEPFPLYAVKSEYWIPNYDRIIINVADAHYSAFVSRVQESVGVNETLRALTNGASSYRGDILVVKHAEDEHEVLNMEPEDWSAVNTGLKWCFEQGVLPGQVV